MRIRLALLLCLVFSSTVVLALRNDRSEFELFVDFSQQLGSVKSFNSVQGAPSPLDPADSDLTDRYCDAGIRFVRVPQDDGFDFTLASIFPDAARDPDDSSSYRFQDIDRLMESIVNSGATPLWEAQYDIGGGDRWTDCCQGGRSPADPEKWADVIRHVLMHFNDEWAGGHRWNIEYVEFINEPFGLGGFDHRKPETMWRAYEAFARSVRRYNAERGSAARVHPVKIVAYADAFGQAQLDRRLGLVDGFLRFAKERDVVPDIFSFHGYDNPAGQMKVADALRRRLDSRGFDSVPLWNTEWNISPGVLPRPLKELRMRLRAVGVNDVDDPRQLDKLYPETRERVLRAEDEYSAFVAVHNVQTKTLLQDSCDEMFVYRANRPSRTGPGSANEYMFFHHDGRPKPAYWTWVLFDRISREMPMRCRAMSSVPLTLLAARADSGELFSLTAAFSGDESRRIRIQLRGLSRSATFRLARSVIAGSTRSLAADRLATLTTDASGCAMLELLLEPSTIEHWRLEKSLN